MEFRGEEVISKVVEAYSATELQSKINKECAGLKVIDFQITSTTCWTDKEEEYITYTAVILYEVNQQA